MREQLRNLVPALYGLGPLQLEGLGDGLTGDGELQGQAPGVQGGLRAWRARLLRPGVHIMGMGEEGGDGRGDERGMQEGLQGARPLGVNRIQAIDRLIQPDAEFHLPAHPIEVGDLPRADPRGQVRQEEAVPLRGLDPHETQRQCVRPPADMHIGVDDLAIEAQNLLFEQRIEVGPREELLRDLPARDIVHLRLPVLFQTDDEPYAMGLAGPQTRPDWHRPGRPAGHTPARTHRSADAGYHAPGPD